MVDFFVPGMPRAAAEKLYVRLEKEAGDTLSHPTARLSLIRWTGDGKGEPVFIASVGEDIDCGPVPTNQIYASADRTGVIIETKTLTHIYTASGATTATIASKSIFGRIYFDDFKP